MKNSNKRQGTNTAIRFLFALTLMLVVAAATSVASFAVLVSEDSVTSEKNTTLTKTALC
jgi:hypothetical protein